MWGAAARTVKVAGGATSPPLDPAAGGEPKLPARRRRSGGRHRCRARERKSEREREREGEDDLLDILGHVSYPKADRVLSAIRVPTCLSGRYGSTGLSYLARSGTYSANGPPIGSCRPPAADRGPIG
jgi:hypothetical protein